MNSFKLSCPAAFVIGVCSATALGVEPNDVFEEATVLPAGVLSVADSLVGAEIADTLLGSRGSFGDIEVVDDDGSPVGDGTASAIYGVPTNSGTVAFAITGFGDDFFDGAHAEMGGYAATVTVRDFFNDVVDVIFNSGELLPGAVDEFSFSDAGYIGGNYDVEVDNLAGISGGDVDFFTFTNLAPGANFVAETFDPDNIEIDTVLGWFDAAGELIQSDDDGGEGILSAIEGTVPDNGQLTFAVTGYTDDEFLGLHLEGGPYELELAIESVLSPGDFDGDLDVDGTDFTRWQRGLSPAPRSPVDLDAWEGSFGESPGGVTEVRAVPEPAAMQWILVLAAALGAPTRRGAKHTWATRRTGNDEIYEPRPARVGSHRG